MLAIGPGWDWTTLCSIYSDMQLYTSQLTALENHVDLHPRETSARFLLAYHYMTAGHTDTAKVQFEQVVALLPGDKLAANLLHMIGRGAAAAQPANAPAAAQPAVPPPAAPAPDAKPVNPPALFGRWHAKRDDETVELELKSDGTFTWKMAKTDPTAAGSGFVSGKFTLQDATLTLKGLQGSMVAQVSIDGGNRFTFKPLGGLANDPGLTFVK